MGADELLPAADAPTPHPYRGPAGTPLTAEGYKREKNSKDTVKTEGAGVDVLGVGVGLSGGGGPDDDFDDEEDDDSEEEQQDPRARE